MSEALATDDTALGIGRRKVWVVARYTPCTPEFQGLLNPGSLWCTIAARTAEAMAMDLVKSLAAERVAETGGKLWVQRKEGSADTYIDLVHPDNSPDRTAEYRHKPAYRVTELVLGADPL